MMTRLLVCCVGAWLAAVAAGCSEPDERVAAATADGAFELTLSAEKNWLRPGESLPVRLRLESVDGPLARTVRDTIEFLANNGSVSPARLIITFVGRSDTVTGGVDEVYEDWLTFTVSSFASSSRQGEIHALFRDLHATLKVRIVDGN